MERNQNLHRYLHLRKVIIKANFNLHFIRDFICKIENNASSLLLKELGPAYYNRTRKGRKLEPNVKHQGNLTLE